MCAPERGLRAVARLRQTLAHLSVQPAESDPVAAAVRIRALLKHRGLVVLFTDLDDANGADPLARAVRLLAPPHLVVVAGVHSGELGKLARREAHDWLDPWVALAAHEHEARGRRQRALLERLGAPVIAATDERLEGRCSRSTRPAAVAAHLRPVAAGAARRPNSQPFNSATITHQ